MSIALLRYSSKPKIPPTSGPENPRFNTSNQSSINATRTLDWKTERIHHGRGVCRQDSSHASREEKILHMINARPAGLQRFTCFNQEHQLMCSKTPLEHAVSSLPLASSGLLGPLELVSVGIRASSRTASEHNCPVADREWGCRGFDATIRRVSALLRGTKTLLPPYPTHSTISILLYMKQYSL
jgi:hypothetical protein